MPDYLLQVGDLPLAYVTAHDDKGAIDLAWQMILDDHRDGVQGRALPATLKTAGGAILLEVTVADVEKRRNRM